MIVTSSSLAWCGFGGTLCDAVGGIYLTYDLLGGHRGPLGILTRSATYGLMFGLGYGVVFGPFFGTVAGIGLGTILGAESWRIARHQRLYQSSPLYQSPYSGVARGLVVGAAAMHPFGREFGGLFGLLSALGLYFVYKTRYNPIHYHDEHAKPAFRRTILTGSALRALALGVAGALAGIIETENAYSVGFGLTVGATAGIVSFAVSRVSPVVEAWVEDLPVQRLGLAGFALIGAGLVLQSVQYVVVILGLTVR